MKNFFLFISILLILCVLLLFFKGQKEMAIDEQSIIIDMREKDDYERGHLKNAIHLTSQEIEAKIGGYVKQKGQQIVLYCYSGFQSGVAAKKLKKMGYPNAVNAGAYALLKRQQG